MPRQQRPPQIHRIIIYLQKQTREYIICNLFSGLEQLQGGANYAKMVWFERVHTVVSCTRQRVGVGGCGLQATGWKQMQGHGHRVSLHHAPVGYNPIRVYPAAGSIFKQSIHTPLFIGMFAFVLI